MQRLKFIIIIEYAFVTFLDGLAGLSCAESTMLSCKLTGYAGLEWTFEPDCLRLFIKVKLLA